MKIIVTGSSGLIGSEAVRYFGKKGHEIIGVDSNLRKYFFGEGGDTSWNLKLLQDLPINFSHRDVDIRDRQAILDLYETEKPDATIHCAAQPSHDLAAKIPFDDFDTNTVGTMNLLEANRIHSFNSPFVYMSTNKVYGDAPNEIDLEELDRRWEYRDPDYVNGISEECRIDQCKHSLFGASKAAADIITQEYGRYFGMPTVSFRGGCLTGPQHSGVELHGFLSYLVKVAVTGKPYTIFGYKGKQVRDQIHSEDVVKAFEVFIENPHTPGSVYNLGGGKDNSASVLECIDLIKEIGGHEVNYTLSDENRIGDHICYYSDLTRLKSDYPNWDIRISLKDIISEMIKAEEARFALES
ncbi:MAG: NAD-dependent epimerase/dehydratase family protein [Bacteroidia bacterium]